MKQRRVKNYRGKKGQMPPPENMKPVLAQQQNMKPLRDWLFGDVGKSPED